MLYVNDFVWSCIYTILLTKVGQSNFNLIWVFIILLNAETATVQA